MTTLTRMTTPSPTKKSAPAIEDRGAACWVISTWSDDRHSRQVVMTWCSPSRAEDQLPEHAICDLLEGGKASTHVVGVTELVQKVAEFNS